MNELNAECMARVFNFLSGRECGVASCTARGWRGSLQDDVIWRAKVAHEYCEIETLEVYGKVFPSFRSIYEYLSSMEKQYPGLALRAIRMWKKLEVWLQANFPELLDSLLPGATEEELNQAESALGVQLPAALRVIYRVRAGQDLLFDRKLDEQHFPDVGDNSMTAGLLGGYQVYNHLVFMRLLTLQRLVALNRLVKFNQSGSWGEPYIAMATSFPPNKSIYTRASDATLVYNAPHNICHPPPPTPDSNDGVLRWMEEYANRLAAGMYRLGELDVPGLPPHRYISLFPYQEAGGMVEAVTRGIRVQASTVFIPESMSRGTLNFAYSIRMYLLPLEEQLQHCPAGTPFKPLHSAQLTTRHWVITDGDAVEEVEGPGVIGEYPLLTPGGPEFVYQSRTSVTRGTGYMEGHFMFVEGSSVQPTGPEFAVACPRFYLNRPDYVF